MKSSLRKKYELGRYILQREGLLAFVIEVVRFLRWCVFFYKSYYICEMSLNEPMKFESTPKIQNFVFEIITTDQRLHELVAKDFDFGVYIFDAREKLKHGALMLCVFIEKELACIHWAAASQEAVNTIVSKIVCRKSLANNEAYLGWSETNPRYRRLGISEYVISEKMKLLTLMGKTTGKWIVEKSNAAPKRLTIKLGGRIYGEGRYLKILWWRSWREKLVPMGGSGTSGHEDGVGIL